MTPTEQNLREQIDTATKIAQGNLTAQELEECAKKLAELVIDLNTLVNDGHRLPKQWPAPTQKGVDKPC